MAGSIIQNKERKQLHQQLGRSTEDAAITWFEARFRVKLIARNYRCRSGEIDCIFEELLPGRADETKIELVFVEVRARSAASWESGVESVGFEKRKRLGRAIDWFLAGYHGKASSIRVDILSWDGVSWLHVQDVRLR